jgi:hypothetical protein
MGPDVPSLLDGPYKDVNPSCDLCRGYPLSYVPQFRSQNTIYTDGFGTQNCLGLYEAALNGNIFNSESCAEVHDIFEGCCSLPNLPTEQFNQNMDSSDEGGSSEVSSSSPVTSQLKISASLSVILLSVLWLVADSL